MNGNKVKLEESDKKQKNKNINNYISRVLPIAKNINKKFAAIDTKNENKNDERS